MAPTETKSRSEIAIPAMAPATPLKLFRRLIVMGISAPPTLMEKYKPNMEERITVPIAIIQTAVFRSLYRVPTTQKTKVKTILKTVIRLWKFQICGFWGNTR